MPIGLYVHIPFCRAKCSYCDFNTYAGLSHLYQPYVDALTQEVMSLAQRFPRRVSTLFLGGGTPTVLPVPLLRQVLMSCFSAFRIEDEAEFTSEANPGTVSLSYLRSLRNLGVNRISLGAQTFDRRELAMLGRIHDVEHVGLTIKQSRAAGFDNLNLDLIYGLPDQTLSSWQRTLEWGLSLAPEHISLYCLTLEEGTPLHDEVLQGRLSSPDPDLAADMYELADDRLSEAGYQQYEISNWCLPGYECAHNLIYWRNHPYLGVGAGAHSSSDGQRWWNVRPVQNYIDRMSGMASPSGLGTAGRLTPWPSPAAEDGEIISRPLEMGETMMLGLRLTREGVADADFRQRFGVSLWEVYGDTVRELTSAGLLTWEQACLRLTERGRLLGNRVFARFLPS